MKKFAFLVLCLVFASALSGACLADVAGVGVVVTMSIVSIAVCVAIVVLAVAFLVKAIVKRRRK